MHADYGVPQRRKRLLLLASSEKKIKLIEPTHKKEITVRDVIFGLSHIGAGETNNRDKLHVASSLSKINLERIRYSIPGGTWRDWPEELILNCHKKKTGRSYSSVYGRMQWDDVALLLPHNYWMMDWEIWTSRARSCINIKRGRNATDISSKLLFCSGRRGGYSKNNCSTIIGNVCSPKN